MKFRVSVAGEDAEVTETYRRWFFFSTQRKVRRGFFATRFVEAEDKESAADIVLKAVRLELEIAERLNKETRIEVDEVREDSAGFSRYAPGKGFTFWKE